MFTVIFATSSVLTIPFLVTFVIPFILCNFYYLYNIKVFTNIDTNTINKLSVLLNTEYSKVYLASKIEFNHKSYYIWWESFWWESSSCKVNIVEDGDNQYAIYYMYSDDIKSNTSLWHYAFSNQVNPSDKIIFGVKKLKKLKDKFINPIDGTFQIV